MLPAARQQEHPLTTHATVRMQQRRILQKALEQVLAYGWTIRSRGATYRGIGHKEVDRFAPQGVNLRAASGIQVLLGHDGTVLTTYRNHDLRKIRPSKRRHSFSH